MPLRVLVTGVTGYMGGSVLSTVLSWANISEHKISIFVLLRGEERAKLYRGLGLQTFLFNSLDESERLQEVASQHDIVIHRASGFHTGSAVALIHGLSQRAKETGKPVHNIHTSGTSNRADQPITGAYLHSSSKSFSDKESLYAYQKGRDALQVYPQRTTDIAVVDTGLNEGVETTIIMSPTIYGIGTDLGNKLSIRVPTIMRASVKSGQVDVIGDGNGEWDFVHMDDLVKLYEIVLEKVYKGEEVPTGEMGTLFSATGRYSWLGLSKGIAGALFKLGTIRTDEVRSVGIEEAAKSWGGGQLLFAELGFASNSKTTSVVTKELGLKPQNTDEDFRKHFLEEAGLVVAAIPKPRFRL